MKGGASPPPLQIQEIKFNVQAQDDQFVKTKNHSGTAYLLEDEAEISLGNGLIQKIYLPNTGSHGVFLDDKKPDYTIFDTEIDYKNKNDFYEKLSLEDSFSVRWETYISIPEKGTYEFSAGADDGVVLTIKDGNETGSILVEGNYDDSLKFSSLSHIVSFNTAPIHRA